VVYYVIAPALYMRSSYREVLRCLLEGVQWLLDPSAKVKVAGKSRISRARSRLGVEPVKQLYHAVVAPIAEKRTRGAWYRRWRLVSLDGSTLDIADTAENEKAFGRPGASRGSSAFPTIRFVALLENGTHVLSSAHMDKYATDELTLAEAVVPALRPTMLCRADRFFPSYKLWRAASTTGADLLWRVRQNARLDVEKRLPDGSYLSRIYASTSDRRNRRNGIIVRIVDYCLKDVPDAEPIYRLVTTILDHARAPARELASALSRAVGDRDCLGRIENPFARRSDRLTRQDTGTGAARVFWAADGALRHPRAHARSRPEGRRRSRFSFLHSVRVVQRRMTRYAAIPPQHKKTFHEVILDEILEERVSSGRNRINPRGVKRKMSNYNLRPRKRQPTRRFDVAKRIRIVK
jgi:hypothetical protein